MSDKKNTVELYKSMKELQLEKKIKDLEGRITMLEEKLEGIVLSGPNVKVDDGSFTWPPFTVGDPIAVDTTVPYKVISNGTSITFGDSTCSWTISDYIKANNLSSSFQQNNN
jgi:hypothetical protein